MKRCFVRLITAITAISACLSCTYREIDAPFNTETEPAAEAVVPCYEYRFAIEESETKATLCDNGVFWEDGDHVGLFAGNGDSRPAPVDVTTNPKTIILSVQQGGERSAMPMVGIPFQISEGEGSSGVIRLRNLGSIIDYRVFSSKYAGETVSSIYFNVSEGTNPISGEASLDITGVTASNIDQMELSWPAEASVISSVRLSQGGIVAATKEAAAESHMYMVVPPGTYTGDFVVETDIATYTFHTTGKVFARNGLKRFNLDLDKAVRVPVVVYSLENQAMAGYFDAVEANPYTPSDNNSYIVTYAKDKSSTNRLDLPKPVPVSWSTPVSSATVTVYNDADQTDVEEMAYVTTTTTSADIYNLIPGREYWYVVNNGNTRIAEGRFRTSGRRRIIRVAESPSGFQYANNCRDFGGLPTIDGRTLKYGKIFRGANMDRTPSNNQEAYIKDKMKVELDVDLRYNPVSQASSDGSYMFNALGFDQIPQTNANVYVGHTQETYNNIDELTNRTYMGATLTRIMNAAINDKVAYIHCKVGADRTAFVCLMLEAVLGVDQLSCDIDYEITSFFAALDGGNYYIDRGHYRKRKDYSNTWYYYPRGVDRINAMSGTTFQDRAVNYVTSTFGIPYSKIQAFQNAMLETAPLSNE